MRGHVYYLSLPEDIRSLYKKRYDEDGLNFGSFEGFLENHFHNMKAFIAGSFIWMGTEEGHDYWEEISDRDWEIHEFMGKPLMKHKL